MLTQQLSKPRIQSVDLLRGLVMIIMALDHTRDFFHDKAMIEDPLNPATTNTILYFTRWITHFCAPVFVFLSGSSIYFQQLRKDKKELSAFLIKRGLWLILFEIVIFNFAFKFDITYHLIALQVIWAIGISMVILGLLIWLPFYLIFAIGLVIILGHNSLNIYEGTQKDFGVLYSLAHRVNFFPLGGGRTLFVLYPFLPWTGLMLIGYCFGKLLYDTEAAQRKRILLWLGISITLFFVIVRFINIYGDAGQWKKEDTILKTVFSFLSTQKYPPSLLYMCMTIGPAIIFMAFFNEAKSRLSKIISVFGRVPFFYYILHFFLIHIVSMIFFFVRGHSFAEGIHDNMLMPYFMKAGEGINLVFVYVVWLSIVTSLYPLCKWYDTYKRAHPEKRWLSYF